jgi:hypothetical protein
VATGSDIAAHARHWGEVWQRAWEAQDIEAMVALYHPGRGR